MRVSNESREGLEFSTLARGLIRAAQAHVLTVFALALVSALDRRLEALAILFEAVRLLAAAAASVVALVLLLLLVIEELVAKERRFDGRRNLGVHDIAVGVDDDLGFGRRVGDRDRRDGLSPDSKPSFGLRQISGY